MCIYTPLKIPKYHMSVKCESFFKVKKSANGDNITTTQRQLLFHTSFNIYMLRKVTALSSS